MSRGRARRWICVIVGVGVLQAPLMMLAPSASKAAPPAPGQDQVSCTPPTPLGDSTPPACSLPPPSPSPTTAPPTTPPAADPAAGTPPPPTTPSPEGSEPSSAQPATGPPAVAPPPTPAGCSPSDSDPSSGAASPAATPPAAGDPAGGPAGPAASVTPPADAQPDSQDAEVTSTVDASPVAGSTSIGTSGAVTPPRRPPSPVTGPVVRDGASVEAADAFRGTVRPVVTDAAGRDAAAGGNESRRAARRAPASGWATARGATAARELIAGNLVGAYGLASPDAAADTEATIVSPSPLAAPHPNGADAHRHKPANATAPGGLGVLDRTGHGARSPQGGMQWSAGGGAAASPLARPARVELVAQPRLRFSPRPVLRLVGMQGRRLERPG
jgi:hypothetical protein